MYGNNYYNPQANLERINNQISELEKIKAQMSSPTMQPITQNFQLAPSSTIRYANTMEDVQKEVVIGDTPFFSKDLSVLWIKNTKGDIKSYELNEIVQKDEKDIKIEYLQAQINEMKGIIANAKSNTKYVDEPSESEKSTNVSSYRTSTKKSK